eukprot:403352247
MENFRGKISGWIMNAGIDTGIMDITDEKNRPSNRQIQEKNTERTLQIVQESIRDASSTENARAIQDSESPTALDQKRLIKTLTKKGWSTNEIIYEVQRVFGHDVLIRPSNLEDERTWHRRYGAAIKIFAVLGALMLFKVKRNARITTKEPINNSSQKVAAQNIAKNLKTESVKIDKRSELDKFLEQETQKIALKEDVFKKLNIK